jgi:hypothetical protein
MFPVASSTARFSASRRVEAAEGRGRQHVRTPLLQIAQQPRALCIAQRVHIEAREVHARERFVLHAERAKLNLPVEVADLLALCDLRLHVAAERQLGAQQLRD